MNTAHKGDGFLFLKENDQIQFCHTTCHDNEEFIYKRDESSNIIKNKSRDMNVTKCDDRLGLVHTNQVSNGLKSCLTLNGSGSVLRLRQ